MSSNIEFEVEILARNLREYRPHAEFTLFTDAASAIDELIIARASLATVGALIRESVLAERAACAAECDRLTWAIDHGGNKYKRPADAERCARAIRARGER